MRRSARLTDCSSCGSQHLGPDCGLSFAERLKTVRLDPRALPVHLEGSKTYYDSQALDEAMGPDRKERMMETTRGLGRAWSDTRGEVWRRDRHSGEAVRVSEKEMDMVYLGGDSEREVDPG